MRVASRLTLALGLLLSTPMIANAVETAADAPEKTRALPLSIEIPAPEVIPGVSHPPLDGVILDLGGDIRLDRPYITSEQANEGCIERPKTAVRFCIDPIDWPAALKQAFDASDVLYKGAQVIIRYDENKSSQAHVLYPAEQFISVIEHLNARYGSPSEEEAIITQIPEKRPVINTIVRWRSIMKDGGTDLILEVRAYDDVRRPFPDAEHGFIWLHRAGAEPIFRQLSVIDLMVLRQRRIGQWPYEGQPAEKVTVQ